MTAQEQPLRPITRPNGKVYRPRKITVQQAGIDEVDEVIVFGTEDREHAHRLAEHEVRVNVDSGYTAVYELGPLLRVESSRLPFAGEVAAGGSGGALPAGEPAAAASTSRP